jgi:hypothetical protein
LTKINALEVLPARRIIVDQDVERRPLEIVELTGAQREPEYRAN